MRLIVAVVLLFLTSQFSVAEAQDLRRGEVLFDLCSTCHGVQAEGDPSLLAPALAGLSQWYLEAQIQKFRSGARGKHPDDIEGMRMRPMSLTLKNDDDVVSVSAYVANLPKTTPASFVVGGDAVRGKTLYQSCQACHGPKAEGREALSGPALGHTGDWYLLSQMEKFKSGVRGANPEDKTGAMMRAMAGTVADEQAVRDVIAHIMTLSD